MASPDTRAQVAPVEAAPGADASTPMVPERVLATTAAQLTSLHDEGFTAGQMLDRARAARAVWNEFPGFKADMVVTIDDRTERMTLVVDNEGDFDLELQDAAMADWVESYLGSVLRHRLPSEPIGSGAVFMGEGTGHPLGRRIKLEGQGMASWYRIAGDVILEVNRDQGDDYFYTSVFSVARNAEGKYLPHVSTVTSWKSKLKKLKLSRTFHETYTRVGPFDLPHVLDEIYVDDEKRESRRIRLENHVLLSAGVE